MSHCQRERTGVLTIATPLMTSRPGRASGRQQQGRAYGEYDLYLEISASDSAWPDHDRLWQSRTAIGYRGTIILE